MNHSSRITLPAVLFGGVIAAMSPSEAHAINVGTALVFACTGDTSAGSQMLDEAAADCGATLGAKSACQVVSGNPWACNEFRITSPDTRLCSNTQVTVTISGNLAVPAGWSVTGNVQARMTLQSTMADPKKCNLIPRNNTAKGGGYVSESGTLKAYSKFELGGALTITNSLTGLSFAVDASASCVGSRNSPAHSTATANSCTKYEVVEVPADPRRPETPSRQDRDD